MSKYDFMTKRNNISAIILISFFEVYQLNNKLKKFHAFINMLFSEV